MTSRRTYPIPNKNLSSSDYIQNKRAKQLFSGTSNLAKTIEQQNGNFPLVTPLGKLKPYQGTFGLSGRQDTSTSPNDKTYCLNTSHSYRDLLAITKGKYLLTPPNVSDQSFIRLQDVNDPTKLYNGIYYVYIYSNTDTALYYMNPAYPDPSGNYIANQIQYDVTGNANERIIVDPSFILHYASQSCILTPKLSQNIGINNGYDARFSFNRTINLDLFSGFQYPIKFSLDYDTGDCINASNDLQSKYAFPSTPFNISPPQISGTSVFVDYILTTTNGDWGGSLPIAYSYQWYRGAIAILGQVNTTYIVVTSDILQSIKCQVTATNSSGSTPASSNSVTPAIPSNTLAPSITPSASIQPVVSYLTCSTGSWSNYPAITGYNYQWYRGTPPVSISGETSSTYTTQTTDDIGKQVTCQVTATNFFGTSSPATPTSNSVTSSSAPVNTTLPSITPTTIVVGSPLTCNVGAWADFPVINPIVGYAYRWLRNSLAIGGATNSTYTTQSPTDIGKTITCEVTATNSIGSSAPATTSNFVVPTSVPVNTTLPSITPTTIVAGSPTPLSCSTGTWIENPHILSYAYEWRRNGLAIGGATNPSYLTQSPIDQNKTITCHVTANNLTGASSPATSSNFITPT
jgi:hypothetical protein